jgi:hypothetical protein
VSVERDAGWHHAARRARLLSWLSLAYMTAEGVVAITAAILAGSVALLGFGLDSAIEGLASVIIIWRFTGTRTLSETAEARAQKAVAVTFFLLAPYIAYDAITTLIAADHASTSWLGIGLSISSLIVKPLLGVAKKRLGTRLDSGGTSGEGARTCCAPTSQPPCSSACWRTHCSAGGGSTRSSGSASPPSPCVRASKRGAARTAADSRFLARAPAATPSLSWIAIPSRFPVPIPREARQATG